jgi:hypothetical protein
MCDGGTADATTFLLRMYLERHDARYKAALDRAIAFVLDSQSKVGAWPQRYPPGRPFETHEPATDGSEEQRFLHFEEPEAENRTLIELRLLTGASWCLDTFLKHGEASLALIDKAALHPAGRWYVAALSWDGRTMRHFVDGVQEMSGDVAFRPHQPGRTSIGVRMNRRSWFKGRIRTIRISPEALPAGRLMKPRV